MNEPEHGEEWPPHLGPEDPPIDLSREAAAYERERERLVRDHLGKIAVVRLDEVVGVYDNPDEAFLEAFSRFGMVKMMFKEICDPEESDYIGPVDANRPSVKRLGGEAG